MLTSKVARRRSRAGKSPKKASALPLTVSHRALLINGSDRKFRSLVHDLLTISARMELVRSHLGSYIGLSGPQYSVLVAVAHFQGEGGTSVSVVAKALHVSSAFVASETGKLAQRGLVDKRSSLDDRRVVLLTVSKVGRATISRIGAQIRAVNDLFFGALDVKAFAALSTAIAALVGSSQHAIQFINRAAHDSLVALEAAE